MSTTTKKFTKDLIKDYVSTENMDNKQEIKQFDPNDIISKARYAQNLVSQPQVEPVDWSTIAATYKNAKNDAKEENKTQTETNDLLTKATDNLASAKTSKTVDAPILPSQAAQPASVDVTQPVIPDLLPAEPEPLPSDNQFVQPANMFEAEIDKPVTPPQAQPQASGLDYNANLAPAPQSTPELDQAYYAKQLIDARNNQDKAMLNVQKKVIDGQAAVAKFTDEGYKKLEAERADNAAKNLSREEEIQKELNTLTTQSEEILKPYKADRGRFARENPGTMSALLLIGAVATGLGGNPTAVANMMIKKAEDDVDDQKAEYMTGLQAFNSKVDFTKSKNSVYGEFNSRRNANLVARINVFQEGVAAAKEKAKTPVEKAKYDLLNAQLQAGKVAVAAQQKMGDQLAPLRVENRIKAVMINPNEVEQTGEIPVIRADTPIGFFDPENENLRAHGIGILKDERYRDKVTELSAQGKALIDAQVRTADLYNNYLGMLKQPGGSVAFRKYLFSDAGRKDMQQFSQDANIIKQNMVKLTGAGANLAGNEEKIIEGIVGKDPTQAANFLASVLDVRSEPVFLNENGKRYIKNYVYNSTVPYLKAMDQNFYNYVGAGRNDNKTSSVPKKFK